VRSDAPTHLGQIDDWSCVGRMWFARRSAASSCCRRLSDARGAASDLRVRVRRQPRGGRVELLPRRRLIDFSQPRVVLVQKPLRALQGVQDGTLGARRAAKTGCIAM
jgi:hypothetical protein